jgi:hypothetical protein
VSDVRRWGEVVLLVFTTGVALATLDSWMVLGVLALGYLTLALLLLFTSGGGD